MIMFFGTWNSAELNVIAISLFHNSCIVNALAQVAIFLDSILKQAVAMQLSDLLKHSNFHVDTSCFHIDVIPWALCFPFAMVWFFL
jgi:hypothetical protein